MQTLVLKTQNPIQDAVELRGTAGRLLRFEIREQVNSGKGPAVTSPLIESSLIVREDGANVVTIDHFTDGVLDPSLPMSGPVRDGGTIQGVTANAVKSF